jgi:hypothetical protein
MENSFFIFSDKSKPLHLERFHICIWEFRDNSALIEFGGEISNPKDKIDNNISFSLYIPWLTEKCIIRDLYDNLKNSDNCRFIFNDSIKGTDFLDEGQQKNGVVQKFVGRSPLCILPTTSKIDSKKKILHINLDIKPFVEKNIPSDTNLYFRFYLEPKIHFLSTRKTGINRSTIIYDIKVNEKRNLPAGFDLGVKQLCPIKNCFYLNIIPNSYDLTFFDSGNLKNIRTLEYESFNNYLKDKRVKKDELVVIFNKKEGKDSYGFFSIFSKERIGAGQFALAVLINLLCGILLFIPSFRSANNVSFFSSDFWKKLPVETYIAIGVGLLLLLYFIWPGIKIYAKMFFSWVKSKF